MDVVEELRQNDPDTTRISITLRYEIEDEEGLAQALEENRFVTEISLDLDGDIADLVYDEMPQWPDWNSLLRVISSRANLEKVILQDTISVEERHAPAAGLVRAFLRAMQQNRTIRRVELTCLQLPTDISTFVDNATSITSFSLHHCDMDPAEREQGTRSLAAALQRNTNIETLELSEVEDIYTVPILESLRFNTSLKTFIWEGNDLRGEIVPAHRRLLESTTSIQTIMFDDVDFVEWQFPLIAPAITNSDCLSELGFTHCQFNGFNHQSCITQLQSILRNKRNLKTLRLHRCDIGREQLLGVQLREDFISILSRPDSQLRCFEYQSDRGSLETVLPGIHFKNLLQAVQKSKVLERFSIGCIETLHQLQTLMQSIPSMHIRELEVAFDGQILLENANLRQTVLLAIKNNFSLRSVEVVRDYSPYLFESAEGKDTLAFYANRNESLDQWVVHPEMVEQKLWPDALGLAERAGPDALFRGLHSVLGRDYVSLPGGRKRKRVQN